MGSPRQHIKFIWPKTQVMTTLKRDGSISFWGMCNNDMRCWVALMIEASFLALCNSFQIKVWIPPIGYEGDFCSRLPCPADGYPPPLCLHFVFPLCWFLVYKISPLLRIPLPWIRDHCKKHTLVWWLLLDKPCYNLNLKNLAKVWVFKAYFPGCSAVERCYCPEGGVLGEFSCHCQ